MQKPAIFKEYEDNVFHRYTNWLQTLSAQHLRLLNQKTLAEAILLVIWKLENMAEDTAPLLHLPPPPMWIRSTEDVTFKYEVKVLQAKIHKIGTQPPPQTSTPVMSRQQVTCFNCQMPGHLSRDCMKDTLIRR